MTGIGETWDDLADDLFGPEPDYDSEPVELHDADAVNRTLGRLEKVRREFAEAKEVADAEIERAREWLAKRREQYVREATYLETQLRAYHASIRKADPKRATIKLPNGELSSTAGSMTWKYTDEAAFIGWALNEGRDDLVRTPERPPPEIDKPAVKKALVKKDESDKPVAYGVVPETNEKPPGLVVELGDTTYRARTNTEVK